MVGTIARNRCKAPSQPIMLELQSICIRCDPVSGTLEQLSQRCHHRVFLEQTQVILRSGFSNELLMNQRISRGVAGTRELHRLCSAVVAHPFTGACRSRRARLLLPCRPEGPGCLGPRRLHVPQPSPPSDAVTVQSGSLPKRRCALCFRFNFSCPVVDCSFWTPAECPASRETEGFSGALSPAGC